MAYHDKYFNGVPDSEFYMWRAVFAFSLVDHALSLEEQDMLRGYLKTVPFSPRQLEMLKADFNTPQNVEAMYKKITTKEDKQKFCVLARALAWCEGDMDRQEENILKHVGCIKGSDDESILRESRESEHLQDFYKHYAKAGMVGLMRQSAGFQMHV